MDRNKKSNLHITCFFIFIFIVLWVTFSYLTGNFYAYFITQLTGNLLLALLSTSFIFIFFL